MTRRRPPQSFGLCLLAALAVMLLPAPLGSAPRVLTPVSVAANPFITNAPLFIGIEEGYFAAQGIEVKLVQLRETAQSWPLLITGQLDAHAGSYTSGFMQAVAQGAKLRILADKGHTEPGDTSIAFMVRQDLIDFGRYRSPRDLRGMRIGVGARGGVGEVFLLQILRNRALVTEQDVSFQQIQQALVLEAFRGRALDAASLIEPFVTRVESLGLAKAVLNLHEVLPRAQTAVIVYGPNLLVRNPGLGERFMNAYLRSIQQYRPGRTERNIAHIAKHTGEDEAILRKTPWAFIHADGHVNVEFIMQTQTWWVREGWLARAVSPDQFLDTSFARRAFQALHTPR